MNTVAWWDCACCNNQCANKHGNYGVLKGVLHLYTAQSTASHKFQCGVRCFVKSDTTIYRKFGMEPNGRNCGMCVWLAR